MPQPGSIIWTAAVFLVLLFVLRKWAWKPILDGLQAREEGIKKNIEDAKKAKEESEKLLEQYKVQLDSARKEAQKLIGDATSRADVLLDEKKKQMETEAQAILDKARVQIDQERQKVVQGLRQEVVEIALSAAGKIIHKTLQPEDHRELINREIEKLS